MYVTDTGKFPHESLLGVRGHFVLFWFQALESQVGASWTNSVWRCPSSLNIPEIDDDVSDDFWGAQLPYGYKAYGTAHGAQFNPAFNQEGSGSNWIENPGRTGQIP